MNQKPRRNGTSKYKGVHWNKKTKRWRAKIKFGGDQVAIGSFHEEKAAAQAYDIKARELFGEFAYHNAIGVPH